MPSLVRKKATMGAKSSFDQGSGSGGVEEDVEPESDTSESPAGRGPRKSREDAVQVQYEQESFLVTNHTPHKRRGFLQSQLGGWLNVFGRKLEHVRDPIDEQAGHMVLARGARFHY
jgi:hypothetical protein